MDLKKFFETIKDQIEDKTTKITENKKYFKGLSLSLVTFFVLLVVIFFANSNLNVKKEADILVDDISNRKYTQAYNYYNEVKKEFSASKMNKFNEVVSKKLSAVVVNSGDKYINGEMTKESYSGLISTINALSEINIDATTLVDISKRVEEMYLNENISYEKASTYMEITTSLNCIYQELDEYKKDINNIYKSRVIYKEGSKFQQIKKYKEAIDKYDRVLEEDKKYYTMASRKKEESIKAMYNYYISQARYVAEEGDYEEALLYLTYLKPYYPNDEKIEEMEDIYREKTSIYTLSSDDILNLISKKSSIEKELLSVTSYQKSIDKEIYYYAEVVKENKIINEVLVEPKTKSIYSYKSETVDYDCEYCDGYYKIDKYGKYIFAISSKEAATLIKDKLSEIKKEYKSFELNFKSEVAKYTNEEELNKLIKENNNIYYYALVKSGLFSLKKDVYLINMYDKSIYGFNDGKITKF